MKPRIKLATAVTAYGQEMALFQHDADFSIWVDGQELKSSRQHESQLCLARLGCAALSECPSPNVFVSGLGLGYTLREVLTLLGSKGRCVLREPQDELIQWHRDHLAELNGDVLDDKRVEQQSGDIVKLLSKTPRGFDAILLDVDNGPGPNASKQREAVYGREGLRACRAALRDGGCLAVWSSEANKSFEEQLVRTGLHVRRFRVEAYPGSKSQGRFVWVASDNERSIPPGGGEPRLPAKGPRGPQGPRRFGDGRRRS